jgi:hypothetical protein
LERVVLPILLRATLMKRLGQSLLQTRRGRLVCCLLIVGALGAASAIIFAGRTRSSRQVALVGSSGASSSAEDGCTTGPADAAVRVSIYGGGEAACSAFDRSAAKTSEEFWHVMPDATQEAGRALVCSMAKGSLDLEVRDVGEHFYGNKLCAQLTAQGWQEQEGPGASSERERETHEAEAKAAAERRELAERAERQHEEAIEERKREAQEHVEQAAEAASEHKEEVREHEELAQEEAKQRTEEHQQHEREAHERQQEAIERSAEERDAQEETRQSQEEAG